MEETREQYRMYMRKLSSLGLTWAAIRMWLIRILAGKMSVALNLTIENGAIIVDPGRPTYLYNVNVIHRKDKEPIVIGAPVWFSRN